MYKTDQDQLKTMHYENSIIFSQRAFRHAGYLFSVGLQSCLNDDDDTFYLSHYYANALVTVKLSANNTPYLQLDDSTTLRPVNMTDSPLVKRSTGVDKL